MVWLRNLFFASSTLCKRASTFSQISRPSLPSSSRNFCSFTSPFSTSSAKKEAARGKDNMVLKVYVDLMSQPCRAVYMFLKAANIPFQTCLVHLRKGEHMTDEFEKLNPFKRVPVIDHDGFVLTESVAILRYLCSQFPVEDHWYPNDPKRRARVDEYMAWQHMNIRINGSMLFQSRVILKTGEKSVANWRGRLEGSLSQMEDHLLKRDYTHIMTSWISRRTPARRPRPFVNGFDEITIADLLCACELEQPISAGYNMAKEHPNIQAYIERVKKRLGPIYDDGHKVAHAVRDRVLEGKL